ncbi:hypothetical protein KC356_g1939 [Hortaea werneckii]|nr:hypothetical protein KC356_g1939 [Hortaea werneckii]
MSIDFHVAQLPIQGASRRQLASADFIVGASVGVRANLRVTIHPEAGCMIVVLPEAWSHSAQLGGRHDRGTTPHAVANHAARQFSFIFLTLLLPFCQRLRSEVPSTTKLSSIMAAPRKEQFEDQQGSGAAFRAKLFEDARFLQEGQDEQEALAKLHERLSQFPPSVREKMRAKREKAIESGLDTHQQALDRAIAMGAKTDEYLAQLRGIVAAAEAEALQQMRVQNEELTTKNEELTNKNEELTNKNGELTNKNEELTNKNGELTNKNEELKAIVKEIVANCAKIEELMNKF